MVKRDYKCKDCDGAFEVCHKSIKEESLARCPNGNNYPAQCDTPGKGTVFRYYGSLPDVIDKTKAKSSDQSNPDGQDILLPQNNASLVQGTQAIIEEIAQGAPRTIDMLKSNLDYKLLIRLPEDKRSELEEDLELYDGADQYVQHMSAYTEAITNYIFLEAGMEPADCNIKGKNLCAPDRDIDFCFTQKTTGQKIYVECASISSVNLDKHFSEKDNAETKILTEYSKFKQSGGRELVFGNEWVFRYLGKSEIDSWVFGKAHKREFANYTEIFSILERKVSSEEDLKHREEVKNFISKVIVKVDNRFFELVAPSNEASIGNPKVLTSYAHAIKSVHDLKNIIKDKMFYKLGLSPAINYPFIIFLNCYSMLSQDIFKNNEKTLDIFNQCFYDQEYGIFSNITYKFLSGVILCGISWPRFDLQPKMTLCKNPKAEYELYLTGLDKNQPWDTMYGYNKIERSGIDMYELLGEDKVEWDKAIDLMKNTAGELQLPAGVVRNS